MKLGLAFFTPFFFKICQICQSRGALVRGAKPPCKFAKPNPPPQNFFLLPFFSFRPFGAFALSWLPALFFACSVFAPFLLVGSCKNVCDRRSKVSTFSSRANDSEQIFRSTTLWNVAFGTSSGTNCSHRSKF